MYKKNIQLKKKKWSKQIPMLWSWICQKYYYGHDEEKCNDQVACGRCSEKDPNHTTDQCQEIRKCANGGGNHWVHATICEKLEKEILPLKYAKNISFSEVRKIINATRKEKKNPSLKS